MTLGGLKQGVTPLDMAHAYETFASGGDLVYGTLSPGADNPRDGTRARPGRHRRRSSTARTATGRSPIELPERRARRSTARSDRNVLEHARRRRRSARCCRASCGTAPARARRSATLSIAGKTGTTEGYGDAWFVGWTPKYTVAVWVGYPNEVKSMETEFNGPAGRRRHVSRPAIFETFIEARPADQPAEGREETPRTPTAPAPGATAGARRAAPPTDGAAARHRRRRAAAPAPDAERRAGADAGADDRRRRRRRRSPAATAGAATAGGTGA